MAFSHLDIEKKWQKAWADKKAFEVTEDANKPKYYALDMFPYPSAIGLHIGHLASYTPGEVVSRFKRSKGYNVLHPMGYDAFGLPAEQYAIKTGIHPAKTTNEAIENFRRQLKSFGFSFCWDREISTCEPNFYKWTQFIFKKLWEKGLAYQKEVPVNWCPALRTVLANEEVIDGRSERGDHPVVRKPMKQWMLKITAYAERLLKDLDKIDWPEATKEGQRNWIGRSEGAKVFFKIQSSEEKIEVFTTRPDTLFGATFLVLAPEHPLVNKITTNEYQSAINDYQKQTEAKSEVDRKAETEKSGAFTGAFAINPVNGNSIPIWIADYVLMEYGSGAIMAVPGHDERDFEFAQKFQLPIKRVIKSKEDLPYSGDGQLIDSDFLNGLEKDKAIVEAISFLEKNKLGEKKVQYKLRDWLFSRQRYWGEPFPLVEYSNDNIKAVPDSDLPVLLPEVADYQPSEQGEPPLARVQDWVTYKDEESGEVGQRITDTMPGSAGSSWYFLRYADPHNQEAPFSFENQKYWLPVDLYIGGREHTVGHLLYARFWQKVLFDAGLVSEDEPFKKLAHQGDILGEDGFRMSKSRGNGVNPDDVREEYGADTLRLYICFLGPFDKAKPWNSDGIEGVRRFLDRTWRLIVNENGECIVDETSTIPEETEKLIHKTIKKVELDIENLDFNTAISAMMILLNNFYKHKVTCKKSLSIFCQLLMPFAPHIAEEMWQKMGHSDLVSLAPWPKFDESKTMDEFLTTAVQVMGKTRGTIEVNAKTTEEKAVAMAQELTAVKNAIEGKSLFKVIYKPGRILNLLVR